MVDKTRALMIDALTHVMSCPEGLPLHGSRSTPGLFPTTAVGRQAAQQSIQENYFRPRLLTADSDPGRNPRARQPVELFVPTDKGITFLFSQTSPRQVLEELVKILQQRQCQVAVMVESCKQMQSNLDALRTSTEEVLLRVVEGTTRSMSHLYRIYRQEPSQPVSSQPGESGNGAESPSAPPAVKTATTALATAEERAAIAREVMEFLRRWQASGAPEDCSLPELYRQMQSRRALLSVGQFHDVLRGLHDAEQIYLHPWTGPLHELPEPTRALLVGHMIAYYASCRARSEMLAVPTGPMGVESAR